MCDSYFHAQVSGDVYERVYEASWCSCMALRMALPASTARTWSSARIFDQSSPADMFMAYADRHMPVRSKIDPWPGKDFTLLYGNTDKELDVAAVHLCATRSQADDAGDEGQHNHLPLLAAVIHRALAVPAGALITVLPEHQVCTDICADHCVMHEAMLPGRLSPRALVQPSSVSGPCMHLP
jgi:hypothetical protein